MAVPFLLTGLSSWIAVKFDITTLREALQTVVAFRQPMSLCEIKARCSQIEPKVTVQMVVEYSRRVPLRLKTTVGSSIRIPRWESSADGGGIYANSVTIGDGASIRFNKTQGLDADGGGIFFNGQNNHRRVHGC